MDTKQFNDILLNVPGSFKAKLDRIRRYLYLEKASVDTCLKAGSNVFQLVEITSQ